MSSQFSEFAAGREYGIATKVEVDLSILTTLATFDCSWATPRERRVILLHSIATCRRVEARSRRCAPFMANGPQYFAVMSVCVNVAPGYQFEIPLARAK